MKKLPVAAPAQIKLLWMMRIAAPLGIIISALLAYLGRESVFSLSVCLTCLVWHIALTYAEWFLFEITSERAGHGPSVQNTSNTSPASHGGFGRRGAVGYIAGRFVQDHQNYILGPIPAEGKPDFSKITSGHDNTFLFNPTAIVEVHRAILAAYASVSALLRVDASDKVLKAGCSGLLIIGEKSGNSTVACHEGVILGNRSGQGWISGSRVVLIGDDVDVPAAHTSDFINIENRIVGYIRDGVFEPYNAG